MSSHPTVFDYDTADAFLHTRGKRVPRKKCGNNTYAERRGDAAIAFRLHNTDVVTYYKGDPITTTAAIATRHREAIVLNTGGWLTMTTASRINDYLPSPWRVRSNRGTWELSEGYGNNVRTITRFTDGLRLTNTGTGWNDWVIDETTTLPGEVQFRQDRHNSSIKRLVSAYIKSLTSQVLDDVESGAGDGLCVLCRIGDAYPHPSNPARQILVTIGDQMEDTQHLVEHMQEGIYPAALLHAAVAAAGYNQDTIMLHTDIVKRCLRKYLTTRLYMGATAGAHGKSPVLTGASA